MTQALQSPFVSSGQLVVVLQHPALQKHEDHSIMTAVLTESFIFDHKKNESIIMICSLPLLLNHPPITVEIPACCDSCRIETASFEKTFQTAFTENEYELTEKPSLQNIRLLP